MGAGNKSKMVYYNPPQYRSHMVGARVEVSILGRGTGKTTGIQAPRIKQEAVEMPRGMIGLVGNSYMQLLTRILPGVIEGFRDLGWVENRDFWVGKLAPKHLDIEKPFKTPLKMEYMIHTKTSAGISLFSQDRPGMSNGVDIVSLHVDEAKFINKKSLDEEIKPAMRGLDHLFGHKSVYHAETYTSDMPTNPQGTWLIEMIGSRKELIQEVFDMQVMLEQIKSSLPTFTGNKLDEARSAINRTNEYLNAIRCQLVHVNVASSLQNIDVLGIKWLEHMLDTLPDNDIQSSLLSIKSIRGKTPFYHGIDWSIHSYQPKPSSHMSALGLEWIRDMKRDCRIDEEYDWSPSRLHIAIDTGGTFNCLLVATAEGHRINVIKEFWRASPSMIRQVVDDFKEYYAYWPNKSIVFHYDHTAIATRTETSHTIVSIVVEALREVTNGKWFVEEHYIGQTPSYRWRFDYINDMFIANNLSNYTVRFNALNCEMLEKSLEGAQSKDVSGKLEKDKSSEKKDAHGRSKIPQERSTHLSENFDLLVSGIYKKVEESITFTAH